MTNKPGILRRIFGFIGTFFGFLRGLINVLFVLFFVFFILTLIGSQTAVIEPIPDNTVLVIDPVGILVEERAYVDPLTRVLTMDEDDYEIVTSELVSALDRAATDQRVSGLILRLDQLGGSFSQFQEVGAALGRFKASGKPISAMAESLSQGQYYLASYADTVILNPVGQVLVTGFGMQPAYFADALQRLKVNINVFKVGTYKDAVEPFTLDAMSDASREHNSQWLNELWRQYTRQVEQNRELEEGTIQQLADNLPERLMAAGGDVAKLALDTGLVDQLLAPTRWKTYREANFGTEVTYLDRYLSERDVSPAVEDGGKNVIAVINADGEIMSGYNPDLVSDQIMAEKFAKVWEDERVAILILRVNSPGGSSFASENIRQLVIATQEQGIPVVVSMGSVAASGGYWISAGADRIYAAPSTLTGSIGVFGVVPTFEGLLNDHLGVSTDTVTTTRSADIFNIAAPLTDGAKAIFQAGVNNTYQQFLALVAEGRDSTTEQVDRIAQGRVWSGIQAQDLGLVDEIGFFTDAVAGAAELAGLRSYELEFYQRDLAPLEQFVEQLTMSAESAGIAQLRAALPENLRRWLTETQAQWTWLQALDDPKSVYARCLQCSAIR